MRIFNTKYYYGDVAKLLHWLVFLLVLCMLIVGYFMDDIGDKSLRGQVYNLHKLAGLTILVLMLLRAVWAFANPKPFPLAGTPVLQLFLERVVHSLLYLVLILMPISGWVMSAAAGHPPLLGKVALNLPVSESKPLSSTAFDLHAWLAIGIIVLVSIHALAALYHYFIKKDDILQRMLPGK